MEPVRLDDLRRHVVAAQGLAPRARRASVEDVGAALDRLGSVQLDSIATVARSHEIVLASRAGRLPEGVTSTLLSEGRAIEYWAHEACLLPSRDWPLFRRRMRERRVHHWWGDVIGGDPALARRVLREVGQRGPLGSRHFEGRNVGMWGLKPAKRMLDALWTAGRLVVRERQGFQRLYDLPERVLPRPLLQARAPSAQKVLQTLAARAVRARGALTVRGIVEHDRLKGEQAAVRRAVDGLVREGVLAWRAPDDGGAPLLVPAEADPAAAREGGPAVLLSPFDNLLWDRDLARRVLAFDHVMEIYKPAPRRKFGYYVMPLLDGTRLVGRADVKTDREAGVVRVRAFHREPGVPASAAADALARATARLRSDLGLQAAR